MSTRKCAKGGQLLDKCRFNRNTSSTRIILIPELRSYSDGMFSWNKWEMWVQWNKWELTVEQMGVLCVGKDLYPICSFPGNKWDHTGPHTHTHTLTHGHYCYLIPSTRLFDLRLRELFNISKLYKVKQDSQEIV